MMTTSTEHRAARRGCATLVAAALWIAPPQAWAAHRGAVQPSNGSALGDDGAAASEPSESHPQTIPVVQVRVDPQVARADALAEQIEHESAGILRQHGVDPTDAGPKSRKVMIDVAGTKFAYRVHLNASHDGKLVALEPFDCECTDTELFARIAQGVDELAVVFEDNPEPVAAPVIAPEPAPAPQPTDVAPVDTNPRLGTLGKSGIALLAVGLAGVGMGAGFGIAGRRGKDSDKLGSIEGRDYRPAGYTLLGLGTAVFLTGAVLLGVEGMRAHKKAAKRTTWAPQLSPVHAGIIVHSRF